MLHMSEIHMYKSVIETRQSKATMPEDLSLVLKRKRRAASGMYSVCAHINMYTYMYMWLV